MRRGPFDKTCLYLIGSGSSLLHAGIRIGSGGSMFLTALSHSMLLVALRTSKGKVEGELPPANGHFSAPSSMLRAPC